MNHDIISSKEARQQGLKHFFSGEPCKSGFVALRMTSNGTCTCSACRRKVLDGQAKHRQENRELYKARDAAYRKNNTEKCADAKKECYRKNNDKYRERRASYYKKNKELFRELGRRYTATKILRTPVWFSELDEFVIREAYSLAKERKQRTGIDWHVDHMIPLKCKEASGLHCASNVQVIPAYINSEKKNRLVFTEPFEWMMAAEYSKRAKRA